MRVTSDDSDFAFDGSPRGAANLPNIDNIQYNDAKSLTCPKGRAYKYRVYHPGKLRYALKQTKQRGDLSGFIRIPIAQAMKEIATKYRKTVEKYGKGAVLNIYGTSGGYDGQGTYASYSNARAALTAPMGTRSAYGDYSYYQYHYGRPLTGHPGAQAAYSRGYGVAQQFPAIAGVVKNVVSWGANMLTTVNSAAWSYIRTFEMLKKRGGRAWFIGPEFTDTGVVCHTDWVQLRNYTDCALIMAMLYEMIVNTFDENGNVSTDNPYLDVNYLDTMVYGFFASPEYWVRLSDGKIFTSQPEDYSSSAYRHVEEVKPGECLAAYIMGRDERLTKALYSNTNEGRTANYTAAKFAGKDSNMPRAGLCSWTVKGQPAHSANAGDTEYLFKKNMMEPKTPEWAEAICGTPAGDVNTAGSIRYLAKMYCDPAQHPIFNEWAGGTQKQGNGSINIWAITALMCVTKTFGLSGEVLGGAWATSNYFAPVPDIKTSHYISSPSDIGKAGTSGISEDNLSKISCKEWFNAIKLAFSEYLTEENGYTGKHIPDWNRSNRYYTDDGSVKATVLLERDAEGNLLTETIDGKTYYKYQRAEDGVSPVYAGLRMIINAGGGIMVNQHMNTNDLTEMYRAIPALNKEANGYENPDGLCLVTFDLFFSPTARYMDYVLPGVSSLEASEFASFGGQSKQFYRPPVVKPLGDAADGWRMAYEAYKAQSDLGEFTKYGKTTTGFQDSHLAYVGTKGTTGEFKPVEDYFNAKVDEAIKDSSSKFYGMTREQVYAGQFTPAANNYEYIATSWYETKGTAASGSDNGSAKDEISKAGQIRKNLDDYLADETRRVNKPFVFVTENGVQNTFEASTYFTSNGGGSSICDEDRGARPEAAGRFQVYNGMVKFDYENLFSKYHGWLAASGGSVGQSNRDHEGDLKVYPIPMYFDFQDSFREAYNGFNGYDVAKGVAAAGPNAAFFSGGKPLTMSTTHDRFRVHSTHDENPFLRELNHRTAGGGWASGNDWQEYCVAPERQAEGSAAAFESPMISSAIYRKDRTTASWHEIWMNTEDAAERQIKDGDLCRVENPIGSVRVIARVTDRCMKGHLNLHQGGWYDPNPADGVDDGGCANTLISSYPSRLDHGNAQQFAYVTIKKETDFTF